MRHPGRTLGVLVTGTVLAAGVVTACDTATRIPPGAQQVHVVGTGTEVRLDTPTVRAGDIYFVIDGPVLFIQHAAAVQGEQSGPMSEDALARLAQKGDTYHTSITAGMGKCPAPDKPGQAGPHIPVRGAGASPVVRTARAVRPTATYLQRIGPT